MADQGSGSATPSARPHRRGEQPVRGRQDGRQEGQHGRQERAEAAAPPAVSPPAPRAPSAAGDATHEFLGRARELAQLHTDTERAGLHTLSGRPSPHSRVLLVAGPPGAGRTALAEEFVRRIADRFPDGVLSARLTDPGGVPVPTGRAASALLAALGAASAPAGADEDELAGLLHGELAGRRAVLLLDDVARAQQLLDLLPDTRDCLVVAVAEGPLTEVPDVRPCALGGLDRESAVAFLARHVGAPHRLTVDPNSARLVAEACGGLPAALALAGGWLAARPKLTVADAAAALDQPARPDPLERAFRLVADSLDERYGRKAARLLPLLALAPAGLVDAPSAAALAGCSVTSAQRLLEEFAALGLLRRRVAAADGSACFTVPGCLDPLLRAELATWRGAGGAGEVRLARARLLERLVRQLWACHATTEPPGSRARDQLASLPRPLRFQSAGAARAWLEARRPAVLAAARAAVADHDADDADGGGGRSDATGADGGGDRPLDTLARRLVSALARAFDAHLSPEEAAPELYRLHTLVLSAAERAGLRREQATALLNLGDLDARTGHHRRALDRYRAALHAARAASPGGRPDSPPTARALTSLGGTYEELGDWARAADWYGRALALHEGDSGAAAGAGTYRLHGRLGAVHGRAGRFADALREWRAAAYGFRRLGEHRAYARALAELAQVQQQSGRYREAGRSRRLALEAARRAGDEPLEATLRRGSAWGPSTDDGRGPVDDGGDDIGDHPGDDTGDRAGDDTGDKTDDGQHLRNQ